MDQHSKVSKFRSLARLYGNLRVIVLQRYCLIVVVNAMRRPTKHNLIIYYTGYTLCFLQKLHRLNVSLMLGQQCRRWTSIEPGITGYLVYCCAALYIVYSALKEHHLLLIILFVNSIQNKVMALVPHILVTSISVIFRPILLCDVEYQLPSIGSIIEEPKSGLLFVFLA